MKRLVKGIKYHLIDKRELSKFMRRHYFNLSLKTKFIILIMLSTSLISITLGYYSYSTSKSQIVDKVSQSNLAVIGVIDRNLTNMQKGISDWITVFAMSSVVQKSLQDPRTEPNYLESALYSGTTSSMMDQMLVTGNFDYLALYGKTNEPLYQVARDGSSGPKHLNGIKQHRIYQKTLQLNGSAYWFPLTEQNNVFIEYNRHEKLGMSRIIRSTLNGEKLGFIMVGVNHQTIKQHYLRSLYDQNHGIVILDQEGTPLLKAGKEFYHSKLLPSTIVGDLSERTGSLINTGRDEDLLLTYSRAKNGWLIMYAVPLNLLTKELDSIKSLVVIIIITCILLSIPISMSISTLLTAPIKKLLASMKRFQKGHFDERVEVKYHDEIGQLSLGYNTMVTNIKSLVDEAYVLRLKEKEAELKALQSQINPHFLYNMLDMIYWEAERSGQPQLGDMVISLSRLFRLSLNRGKSFTSLGKEKEFILLYLSLQQMRFKDRLTFNIDIADELESYVILKLCLQPFIENALYHGIESKREGGFIHVTASLKDQYLHFEIQDNGGGMNEETLMDITKIQNESDVYTSHETGGYAIQNVIERLHHYYKDDYVLSYESELKKGTLVKLVIPAITITQEEIS
ncbi:cache domain-containing sensor histidine kinase [Litchfieldia salsa]|uniref:Two-component system, sensor histidine kinase YesM n=1 Tax=Litchfieldia salsa TaxID=930152 RepID=A0A1H0X2I9_9BACI|nr:sensor histidine kinase [Litchfieldia salsa]SDP97168.1 two-component system, sensor histidine kinase YesM [Litchfieldia salsa]